MPRAPRPNTGTYSASSVNCENNALATDDAYFVRSYQAEFERLWGDFHKKTHKASNLHEAAQLIQNIERGRRARSLVQRQAFNKGKPSAWKGGAAGDFPTLGK